ncbi:phytanoyl-CoA dioxygenase family protein [Paenibacillus mendelii]|uniref:Phytanoyl-CoA dioxygenase family protein n=1 Tax=Paenibacillus mendelii TaxID=206163 RepID=A0ABV6JEJ9_9BACL|nr:phytanoyl-CoA dioxygenase family protein [Paenibacillus mendelii]MCQ6557210.1 phytanoyl-CoA dioxygenase family protein [Paenibacillus mendelii]
MLTQEQVSFFKENGYLIVDNFYTREQIAEYKAALEETRHAEGEHSFVHNQGGPYSMYEQKVNLWRDFPKIRELTFDPRRAAMVKQLTDATEVRLFHDHYLIKPPMDSRASNWHQDQPAWPISEVGPINCWIPFQDVTIQNGAMAYVAGSHRWGVVKYKANRDDEQIEVEGKSSGETKVVAVPIQAGSFLFHHGLTLHYAYPNKTDQPRYAMTVIYLPDWTTYNGNRHPVTEGLHLTKGQRFNHDMFPVLTRTS